MSGDVERATEAALQSWFASNHDEEPRLSMRRALEAALPFLTPSAAPQGGVSGDALTIAELEATLNRYRAFVSQARDLLVRAEASETVVRPASLPSPSEREKTP